MVVTETIAGLSAIKTAFDMTKALKDINDAAIRNAAVIELQEKILSARDAQTALFARSWRRSVYRCRLETRTTLPEAKGHLGEGLKP
jgi:hypothetical protein